ncbi:hypothetical protein CO112_00550 [Candidatus Dojkabacteria bacterium CG_4_9_14_3_um_filter_150_Dojkabacteria_WS6_41_13]|nr:MAG: hypothetical protein CO112_00550 [Candidatus Dojkabacteria bacterium CG_4_9_14_3_um_filter_150_Dojkabacteria_WS6_41_13]
MLKDLSVAVLQTTVPTNSTDGEAQVERLVKEATSFNVDMVGLPEDCITPRLEISTGYAALNFLSAIAKKYSTYLFGATGVLENDGIHDRGFLFNREGKLILAHDKIVLTPPEVEQGVVAGATLNITDTEFGRIAILVCKDTFHRYAPWFFNELRKSAVDIVLVPSYSLNVSKRSIELWVDSLKAQAKWFDLYIVAPGTIGKNLTAFPSFGHSLIICPNRVVLAEGSTDKEEILTAKLDVESLETVRKTVGALWQPETVPAFTVILH